MNSSAPTSTRLGELARRFHEDEDGVVMTEYILVFSFVVIGTTISIMATAASVRAYRDFLVWWMTHPAV